MKVGLVGEIMVIIAETSIANMTMPSEIQLVGGEVASFATAPSMGPCVTRLMPQDFDVLNKWVKTGLFEHVKFIANPEVDLDVKETFYQDFVKACKNNLVGLKDRNPESANMYCEMLWQEAIGKKGKGKVTDTLSNCRSTVYSAMGHRFVGTWLRMCARE